MRTLKLLLRILGTMHSSTDQARTNSDLLSRLPPAPTDTRDVGDFYPLLFLMLSGSALYVLAVKNGLVGSEASLLLAYQGFGLVLVVGKQIILAVIHGQVPKSGREDEPRR